MPKKVVCTNCSYNIMKQLVKLNQLLWNIDDYIKDAVKAGDQDVVRVLKQIKEDNAKNAQELKRIIVKKAKTNEL